MNQGHVFNLLDAPDLFALFGDIVCKHVNKINYYWPLHEYWHYLKNAVDKSNADFVKSYNGWLDMNPNFSMETRNFVTQWFKMSGNEDKFDKLEKFILYKGTTK